MKIFFLFDDDDSSIEFIIFFIQFTPKSNSELSLFIHEYVYVCVFHL
jgi:hypothetical protein